MNGARKVASAITDTADEARWHPLELISPARAEWLAESSVRTTFLARLTIERLREADEDRFGLDTLAEHAAWSAKIMQDELHLDSEAKEALELKAKFEAKWRAALQLPVRKLPLTKSGIALESTPVASVDFGVAPKPIEPQRALRITFAPWVASSTASWRTCRSLAARHHQCSRFSTILV